MNSDEFYKEFTNYLKRNMPSEANMILMNELGRIMVAKREDFIYLLKYSGISVPENASDLDLINLFIDNVKTNSKLLLGVSFLISHNNKMVGFDGEEYTSNVCADAIHKSMYKFFDGKGNSISEFFDGERMSSFDGFDGEEFSYETGEAEKTPAEPKKAEPKKTADWASIGKVAEAAFGLGSQALKNVGDKRAAKNLPQQMTAAQQKAKAALLLSSSKERLAKEKSKTDTEKSKRTKMIVIGGSVALVLFVVGIIAYKKLKK